MTNIQAREIPNDLVITSEYIPPKYKTYQLSGASSTCATWSTGTLITQNLEQPNGHIQLFVIDLKTPQTIEGITADQSLVLSCILKGKFTSVIDGFGKAQFRENDLRLAHLPAEKCHHSHLNKGLYVILNLPAAELATLPATGRPYPLHYIIPQHCQGYHRSLLQLPVIFNGDHRNHIKKLTRCTGGNEVRQTQIRQVLNHYTEGLVLLNRDANINSGHSLLAWEIKKYIDEHLSGDVSIDALVEVFELSDNRLKDAFRYVLGQSIGRYTMEERMQFAINEFSTKKNILVNEVADRVGMEPDYFTRCFNERFGLCPSAFINKKQAEIFQAVIENKYLQP
jgi:AraC-like DNA-binding protein